MSSERACTNLSAVAWARGFRSHGSLTAFTVGATQWANSHPAVMIQFSHKGPQIGNVAGHLPCPIGMTLRPRAASRGVLDAVRMRRQVDLDRLNAANLRFRPEIEDLGGKRMGDGDDGEIRLFAQIEPQSQGTMCLEQGCPTAECRYRHRSVAA